VQNLLGPRRREIEFRVRGDLTRPPYKRQKESIRVALKNAAWVKLGDYSQTHGKLASTEDVL
jgi:hypothetical protein